MSVKRFKLNIAKTDYWVWVLIYPNVHELRAAAAKYDADRGVVQQQKGGGAGGFHSRALGLMHRSTGKIYAADGSVTLSKKIGIMRLAEGHLSALIVSHEIVHAVLWAYRLKFNHANMGRMWGPLWREEFYAHMYGDTFSAMMVKLHKAGYWH